MKNLNLQKLIIILLTKNSKREREIIKKQISVGISKNSSEKKQCLLWKMTRKLIWPLCIVHRITNNTKNTQITFFYNTKMIVNYIKTINKN